MSSSAFLELDFFKMEKENPSKSQFQRLLQRRNNIRGVQTSLSNFNPHFLKTVIESGTANGTADKQEMTFRQKSVPSTPKGNQPFVSALPLFNPALRAASETAQETQNAPLTIFYNGKVTVFDVPRDKAEIIMKLVEDRNLNAATESVTDLNVMVPSTSSDEQQKQLLEKLKGGEFSDCSKEVPAEVLGEAQRELLGRKHFLTYEEGVQHADHGVSICCKSVIRL